MSPSGCLSVLALHQTGGLSRVYTASCTMVAGMDGCTLNAYGSNPVFIAFNICLLIGCPRKRIQEKQIMSGSCQHFQIKRLVLESVQKKGTIKFLKLNKNTLYLLLIQWIFTSRNTLAHIYTHTVFFKHTQQAFNCSFCSLAFIQPQQQCRETAILDGCEMLIPMEKEHFKQFVPGPEAAFVLHCLKSDDSEEKCKNE